METLWRVRDKYNVASDASSRPPLRADDFIDSKTGTDKACARREYGLCADRLLFKLARQANYCQLQSI
jgi:hypothetical protein